MLLTAEFFQQDTCQVARELLGKVIRRKINGKWLAARIIETEAYYLQDRGSHASLGYTEKRKALFMPAGTIYMYYARGKDSLNISCSGEGNAVLIKSAFPYKDEATHRDALKIMQRLNPAASGAVRPLEKLCRGQTLLCQALDVKVAQWDQQVFDENCFYIDDTGEIPDKIIQTTRLGIPHGRDEQLFYRFIDFDYTRYCTSNPLSKRSAVENRDYKFLKNDTND